MSCKRAALGFYQAEGVTKSAWDSTPSRLAPLPGLGPPRMWEIVRLLCVVIGTERRAHCWVVSVLRYTTVARSGPVRNSGRTQVARTEGQPGFGTGVSSFLGAHEGKHRGVAPRKPAPSPRPPAWTAESPSKPLAMGDPVWGPNEKWRAISALQIRVLPFVTALG